MSFSRVYLNSYTDSIKRRARSDSEIQWFIAQECCKKRCNRKVSFDEVRDAESRLLGKQCGADVRQWILDYLIDHSKTIQDGKSEKQMTSYIVGQKLVCQKFWLFAYNIRYDRLRRIIQDFTQKSITEYIHGNSGEKRTSVATADSIAWLQFFIGAVGNWQPDSDKVQLPSVFKKTKIYQKMKHENVKHGLQTVSPSHFYRIWQRKFKHVTIPKVS